MTSILGSIFLGGTGLVVGMMIGKSIVKEEEKISTPAVIIVLAVGLFFMCGALWVGALNHWI
jgi:hypothetical protein